MLPVTFLCTAILGIMFAVHSVRTVLARGSTKTNLGVGDSELLLRRVRAHGNFAEYVPLLIIILGLLEYADIAAHWLYIYGSVVIFGRILHAYGISTETKTAGLSRIVGMVCTLTPLALGSITLLVFYFLQ